MLRRLTNSETGAEAALTSDPTSRRPTQAASSSALDARRACDLERLEQVIGYRFCDPARLDLALTHSSVAYEQQQEHAAKNDALRSDGKKDDNEQLEFLGDAVLGLAVTEHLFRAYPEFAEGTLTRLRAQFVSRQHLWHVAQQMGLGEFLSLGKGEERSGGRRKAAILANAVEALIAAIYLDGGLEPAVRIIDRWLLRDRLDSLAAAIRSGEDVGDHKSALQEYFQAQGLGQPRYVVTSEAGPDHRKSFGIAVKRVALDGSEEVLASATGTRKKHAEQEAARLALLSLKRSASPASNGSVAVEPAVASALERPAS